MVKNHFSNRELYLWRAYLEVLNERVTLVDHWSDGTVTWHPRAVQKLIWYAGLKNTIRNRWLVHAWLMRSATKPIDKGTSAR
jgi:hypothetical protein